MVETTQDPWPLEQLQMLLRTCPDRVERALSKLWEADPDLHRDLAIGALDQGRLSEDACAARLGVGGEEVAQLLEEYRRKQRESTGVIERRGNTACIAGTQITVWEIVRESRRLGDPDLVIDSFPVLSHAAIQAALSYAERHASEIEASIDGYEERLARRRSEYPFAN